MEWLCLWGRPLREASRASRICNTGTKESSLEDKVKIDALIKTLDLIPACCLSANLYVLRGGLCFGSIKGINTLLLGTCLPRPRQVVFSLVGRGSGGNLSELGCLHYLSVPKVRHLQISPGQPVNSPAVQEKIRRITEPWAWDPGPGGCLLGPSPSAPACRQLNSHTMNLNLNLKNSNSNQTSNLLPRLGGC